MPVESKGLVMRGGLADRQTGTEVPTFDPGRICKVQSCRTRLSVYNPADVCWQHERVRPFYLRVNGRRRRAEENKLATVG